MGLLKSHLSPHSTSVLRVLNLRGTQVFEECFGQTLRLSPTSADIKQRILQKHYNCISLNISLPTVPGGLPETCGNYRQDAWWLCRGRAHPNASRTSVCCRLQLRWNKNQLFVLAHTPSSYGREILQNELSPSKLVSCRFYICSSRWSATRST